jgi:hypothetical protein
MAQPEAGLIENSQLACPRGIYGYFTTNKRQLREITLKLNISGAKLGGNILGEGRAIGEGRKGAMLARKGV